MNQSDMPEIQTRNEHFAQDFLSTAAATVIGAAVGSYIDKNTRIGIWVNNSPATNAFFGALKLLGILAAIGAVILYMFLFFTAT